MQGFHFSHSKIKYTIEYFQCMSQKQQWDHLQKFASDIKTTIYILLDGN